MRQMHNDRHEMVANYFMKLAYGDGLFKTIEHSDFLMLYYISLCSKEDPEGRVYLKKVAEETGKEVVEVSKTFLDLQDKAYLLWDIDESKTKTYVTLSKHGEEALEKQWALIHETYDYIMDEIEEEKLVTMLETMKEIQEIIGRKASFSRYNDRVDRDIV